MANKLDPMDLKQIISLHVDGHSNRSIAKTLCISRNTVNNYMRLFKASEYRLRELLDFDNGQLHKLFPSLTTIDNARYSQLMDYFKRVNQGRNHAGFTFLYHYQEYVQLSDNPYSYTQFMEHYKRKYAKIKGSMKLEHDPGKEMYIDFAGKKLQIVDKQTGELEDLEVFVAILPNSQYTYVRACRSQKREDLISCCIQALNYYGGAPTAIVVEACIAQILTDVSYPEIGYKRAMGLIQLHKTYGSQRLDKAYERALKADAVSYKRIQNILKNNLDQSTLLT